MHYCYILYSTTSNRTYVGYTVDPRRRLRQHNGLISGGAKSTRNNQWDILTVIGSSNFSKTSALSFEWHVKHVKQHGINGRLRALINTINNNTKFKGYQYCVFVSQQMQRNMTTELMSSLTNTPFIIFDNLDEFVNETNNSQ
jgi:predicted GIY-YIG superfamily endonuclease